MTNLLSCNLLDAIVQALNFIGNKLEPGRKTPQNVLGIKVLYKP